MRVRHEKPSHRIRSSNLSIDHRSLAAQLVPVAPEAPSVVPSGARILRNAARSAGKETWAGTRYAHVMVAVQQTVSTTAKRPAVVCDEPQGDSAPGQWRPISTLVVTASPGMFRPSTPENRRVLYAGVTDDNDLPLSRVYKNAFQQTPCTPLWRQSRRMDYYAVSSSTGSAYRGYPRLLLLGYLEVRNRNVRQNGDVGRS